jgi:peroxiredoxin
MCSPLILGAGILLTLLPHQPLISPPAVGAKVADFTLQDANGQPLSFYAYRDKSAIVVVFIGNDCPIANLYFATLAHLDRKYADKGVKFLAINSNDQDTMPAVVAHARERKISFPVLKDLGHQGADALGARRTPEAFLLDSDHIIRYRGRIDDQYGYSYRRPVPTKTELKDAIDLLLAGKPILVTESDVRGCMIGRDKN